MGKPYKCPVCGGRGTILASFYSNFPDTYMGEMNCKSCHGTGIVYGSEYTVGFKEEKKK